MKDIDSVKDKIAKLLALADSPNENEAKASLLKARELMAEYKLLPEQITRSESVKVIRELVGVTCTKMTDTWACPLSGIIANQYCCMAYREHVHGAKKVSVGLIGLEEDFEICKYIFLYAYDCVKARCKEIDMDGRKAGYSGSIIREMCNAYGIGFCKGLQVAFLEQTKKHQEWGLVMVVPQEVCNAVSNMGRPSSYGQVHTGGWRAEYADAGYQAGRKFDPNRRIERKGQERKNIG